MKTNDRKKLLQQKKSQSRKKTEKKKTIFVYMDSSFVGSSLGTGALLLDGTELGFFGRRSKNPNAKKKWYCSVLFNQTKLKSSTRDENYRFNIQLLELFEDDYSFIAAELETIPGANRSDGEVREVQIDFSITLAKDYNIDLLPGHCPHNALQTLMANKMLLNFRLFAPAEDSLSDLQIDRLTELIWWLALQVPARRTILKLNAERLATLEGEVTNLESRLIDLNQQLSVILPNYTSVKLSLTQAQSKFAEMETDAANQKTLAEETIAACQAELHEVQRVIEELEAQLATATTKVLKLAKSSGKSKDDLKTAQYVAEQFRSRVNKLRSLYPKLNAKLRDAKFKLNETIQKSKSKYSELHLSLESSELSHARLEREILQLQQNIDITQSALISANQEISELR